MPVFKVTLRSSVYVDVIVKAPFSEVADEWGDSYGSDYVTDSDNTGIAGNVDFDGFYAGGVKKLKSSEVKKCKVEVKVDDEGEELTNV